MNLGENIYRLRTEKNMSQGDLADALEVSRQSVSKWENNSAVPELEKLVKMAQVFGVTIDELVTGEEKEPKNIPTQGQASQVIYVEKTASGISGVKLLGAILLFGAFLLALLVNYDLKYDLSEAVWIALPVALCGIFCLVAKHPLMWCGWVIAAGYWVYFFILSYHWEEEIPLMSLGFILVVVALVYTIVLHKRGTIHVQPWVWALLALVLSISAILLGINLLPPVQGLVTPVAPQPFE